MLIRIKSFSSQHGYGFDERATAPANQRLTFPSWEASAFP